MKQKTSTEIRKRHLVNEIKHLQASGKGILYGETTVSLLWDLNIYALRLQYLYGETRVSLR